MGNGRTLKAIAAEAGLTLAEARERLAADGARVPHQAQPLAGRELAAVRIALGLVARPRGREGPAEKLSPDELDRRLLRPLLRKGKLGARTTPVENVYGHGVPDHQKAEAKERVLELIKQGLLAEKDSQSRLHVFLTPEGRARALELGPGEDEG